MNDNLRPLILDLFEPISVIYDENGEQLSYDVTTVGTPENIDSHGRD